MFGLRIPKWMFLILVSLICGCVTSCTVSMSKEEQAQNILPTPSIESSLAKALGEPSFTAAKWPERDWWEQYGSKELNALIETALRQNPTIQSVRERISFAKAEAVIARSEFIPLVFFDASDQWQYLSQNGLYRRLNSTIPLNSQQLDFSLSFSWELDFWGKYHNLYHAAVSRQRAAIAESKQAELITSTALAQAYFALRTNLLRKALYERLYEVRKSYFELQTKMLQNSLYSKLVPLLSEELVFQAEQWLYNIEQEIAVDKHLVNILAGLGPDEPLALDAPFLALPQKLALPTDISMELLARRPDLMAQIWRVDGLAFEVGAAKADFWPDVSITGILGFQSLSWSKLFEWASKTVGALPALSLPVYTAGAIGAGVDAKKALFNEAVYHYNDLILKSFQQVADLLAVGRAVYGEKEKQSQIVANASARYDLTRLRQKNGIDDLLTSYQFFEELIQKELDNVQLLYQQYLVSISLIRALGGGYLSSGADLDG